MYFFCICIVEIIWKKNEFCLRFMFGWLMKFLKWLFNIDMIVKYCFLDLLLMMVIIVGVVIVFVVIVVVIMYFVCRRKEIG